MALRASSISSCSSNSSVAIFRPVSWDSFSLSFVLSSLDFIDPISKFITTLAFFCLCSMLSLNSTSSFSRTSLCLSAYCLAFFSDSMLMFRSSTLFNFSSCSLLLDSNFSFSFRSCSSTRTPFCLMNFSFILLFSFLSISISLESLPSLFFSANCS